LLKPYIITTISPMACNPRGRPRGARNRLSEEFIAELYNAFVANGRAAIERVVEEDPAAFLRIVASLVSKDIKIDRRIDAGPLSDFTDEELEALLYAAQNAVAEAENTSASVPQISNHQRLPG